MLVCELAFNVPLRREFSYLVPPEWGAGLQPGDRVVAPLSGRVSIGIVTRVHRSERTSGLREILRPAAGFRLPDDILRLTRWTSEYYLSSWGEALFAAAGPSVDRSQLVYRLRRLDWDEGANAKSRLSPLGQSILDALSSRRTLTLATIVKHVERNRGTVASTLRDLIVRGLVESEWRVAAPPLSKEPTGPEANSFAAKEPGVAEFDDEQKVAWQNLSGMIDRAETGAALLWGPTGSGKTALYCAAIRACWERGRSALFLVPEINLASQMIRRLAATLGGPVAIWHSGLPASQRFFIGQMVAEGKYRLVVGARSAIFAPLANLGLIIVDEEHSDSYKQSDPAPRYHARDLAVVRAGFDNALCLLGSATPSCESIYNAQSGKYKLLRLTRRVRGRSLPIVRVVDLRHHGGARTESWITNDLRDGVLRTVREGRKAIVFLNRRGHSTLVTCKLCGHSEMCEDCGLALTYHASGRSYRCHICGKSKDAVDKCPACSGTDFLLRGAGTQRIEESLAAIDPDIRLARLDSDVAAHVGAADNALDGFAADKYNLLVGTQMVTKGLDVASVGTVGVIWADQQMAYPDFRAEERTFQLLTQVAGRAGRGHGHHGEVIVQTFHPDHELIALAAAQDSDSFYERELPRRRELGYPPFARLILLSFASENPRTAMEGALHLAGAWRLGDPPGRLLGPAPAIIPKRGKTHYVNALIKTTRIRAAIDTIRLFRDTHESSLRRRRVAMTIDVDPVSFM